MVMKRYKIVKTESLQKGKIPECLCIGGEIEKFGNPKIYNSHTEAKHWIERTKNEGKFEIIEV